MIIFVAAAVAAAAADPSAGLLHKFMQCLTHADADAKTQKVTPDAFAAFMRQQCAGTETPYRASLVSADVQHGMSHKSAISDAASLIESYYSDRNEDYAVSYKLLAPKTEAATAPSPQQAKVTPAAAPAAAASQPPKP